MNPLQRLFGQTAIYGLSSIFARFLNFLLVPVHTYLLAEQQSYGIVTSLYAYAGFFIVILPHGMETAFFRFAKEPKSRDRVYSMAYLSVFLLTSFFLIVSLAFTQPVANFLLIPQHPEYIAWFGIILAFDAFATIPFARLRQEERAKAFALLKIINIAINIGVTLFFLGLCRSLYEDPTSSFHSWAERLYNPHLQEGYIFIANLSASTITLVLLFPYFKKLRPVFDPVLWKRMLAYAWPIMIMGLAGIINEMLDRLLLLRLLPQDTAMEQVGIYGACYKLTMIITISVQAFRYAAEPFFFKESERADSRQIFADVMKYFSLFLAMVFLGTLLYLDILKYFIAPAYHEGLKIVPVLLLANIFLGLLYNLSIWYKLTDKTIMGAWIAIGGAVLTVMLNLLWIPTLGYMGAAWATLACYASMTVVSWLLGRKHYPVPYHLPKILGYPAAAVGLYFLSNWLNDRLDIHYLAINTLIFLTFAGVAFVLEKPKKLIP